VVVCVDGICKKQQKLVYSVVQYCYNELTPHHDVDIFITLKSSLSNNLNGWCQHNHNNNFEILLDSKLQNNELIKTVCHEMVHVKQGVKNELTYEYNDKYCRMWKGIEYISECPWEIEAYQLEKELFNSYMEQREKN